MSEVIDQINPENHLFVKCGKCGYGILHKDKKWCKRCIDVWTRKQALNIDKAEKTIASLVEQLHFDACYANLDEPVVVKLDNLQYGQDVFFYGDVGVGKTWAMAAMIKKYTFEGYECERINFDDFCVNIRSTYAPAATQTECDVIEPLKHIDKLFIDDLGLRSKQESDFAYTTFFSLLNKRQERMLPTFISSNKSIEQLSQSFDNRIGSRLRTALVIHIKGIDRRKAKRAIGE